MSTCLATAAATRAAGRAGSPAPLPEVGSGPVLALRPVPSSTDAPRELVVACAPGSVSRARRWATDQATALGATADEVCVVELLASEVVTNAIRHGSAGGDVVVRVTRHADGVLVAVHDDGRGAPVVREPSPEEAGGRGMQLVDVLAAQWGAQSLATGGKCVWFVVALAAATAAA
ncbi:ATP-binding protein [Cellulomonas carbonis]|uniref:ATP-binding protein n=1 Tax=Cellulomonas carbonis T26 TaxID=947969 RepID=A0A0A0BUG7_9CELL|nr:ATP-binding protein [Cellulomonas carbonis]KGM11576.1 ATP-binding protein [Cellulomonas carbonis T26]GGC06793.1 hypothetical protein GCM10010972_20060 [Cellulomonas carbonis]